MPEGHQGYDDDEKETTNILPPTSEGQSWVPWVIDYTM